MPHRNISRPAVLSILLILYKMYLGYFILVPLLIVLWIYVIIIVKNNFVSNTSIEVNIIDHQIQSHRDRLNSSGTAGIFEQTKKKIKHHIPKFMLELYEENKSVRKNEADLVRSLIPTQAEKLEKNEILEELSENHLLIFNIPNSAKEERFIGAELKILTQIEINSKTEIGVKKFLKISVYDDKTKSFSYVRELEIHHFNDTWLSFNLTKEVEDILGTKSGNRILKVIITVSTFYHQSQNNLKLSILPATEITDHDHDYPVLLLSYSIEDAHNTKQNGISKTKQTNHVRKRRDVDEDYEEETNMIWTGDNNQKKTLKKYKRNNCRRRPLYVDFSEIKYDLWIVQPTGYDAYQCQGRCFYPVAEHLSPTKHAIMQALIHSFNPLKASRSCCVPTLLDSISILYVDDKGVLTYRYAYKDMVVLECGCR